MVARIDGVADRDAAEALNGLRLYVERARPCRTEEDEFYHADLIGLAAAPERRQRLGRSRWRISAPATCWRSTPEAGGTEFAAASPSRWCRWSTSQAGRRGDRSAAGWSRPSSMRNRKRRPPMADAPSRRWTVRVLTLFPEMFPGRSASRSPARRWRPAIWRLETVDIRDFARDKHRTVDDAPFGGGPGMVMRPDVLDAAIAAALGDGRGPVIYLTPRGRLLDQARGAGACGAAGVDAALRPLRRGRRAGDRGARASRRSASAISCCRAASRRRWR